MHGPVKEESILLGIFEFPIWKEISDIVLVTITGFIFLLISLKTTAFAMLDSDGSVRRQDGRHVNEPVAKSLYMACFLYAGSQFLTNHAEAQGVMLSVLWVAAAYFARKRNILLAAVTIAMMIIVAWFTLMAGVAS